MTSEGTHKDRRHDDNDKHYTARIWFTHHRIVTEQRFAYYRLLYSSYIFLENKFHIYLSCDAKQFNNKLIWSQMFSSLKGQFELFRSYCSSISLISWFHNQRHIGTLKSETTVLRWNRVEWHFQHWCFVCFLYDYQLNEASKCFHLHLNVIRWSQHFLGNRVTVSVFQGADPICFYLWSSGWVYLVQRVNAGLVTDSQVMFELPHGPHARPAVLLAHRQQQGGDRVVKLRNTEWIPGAQEHNICRTNATLRHGVADTHHWNTS